MLDARAMRFTSFCLPLSFVASFVHVSVAACVIAGCSSGGAGTVGDDGGNTSTSNGRTPGSTPGSTTPADGKPPGVDASVEACTGALECTPDQCLCNDGTAARTSTACVGGTCKAGDSMCDPLCKAHGGIASIRPLPNVKTSTACKAFCEKARALGCAKTECDDTFFCSVDIDECAASKEAFLQCGVDQGTWSCNPSGSGWSVNANGCRAANQAGCDSRP